MKRTGFVLLLVLILACLAEGHKGKGKHEEGKSHHGKGKGKHHPSGKDHSKDHSSSTAGNQHGSHGKEDGHRTGPELTCKFEALNYTYDFSRLSRRSFLATEGEWEVTFAFCSRLSDLGDQHCPPEAAACRHHNGTFETAGVLASNEQPQWNLFEGGVTMSLLHGDTCLRNGTNSTRSTHVHMTCDPHTKFEVDSLQADECDTVIQIRTRRACPYPTHHGKHQRHHMRKNIVFLGIIVLTSVLSLCVGICGICCLIRKRRQQRRAQISAEFGQFDQPQMIAAPMGVFNLETMHAMYPNVEMYPMQTQVVATESTFETDEEMARRLQAELNSQM